MEEKHNNATPQRPEGARALNASVLPIDMLKFIEQIKNEEAYLKNEKNAITVLKTKQVTVTIVALKPGEMLHPGNEEGVGMLILQVIDGYITFESRGERAELRKGYLLSLNDHLSFTARAKEESICLLTLFK
jgi:hypothetical protein